MQKDIAVNSKESKKNVSAQKTEGKSRIKQKSLSAIFAKKLKSISTVADNVLRQSQVLSEAKDTTVKVTETGKIKQSDAKTDEKTSRSNKISSTVSSNVTHESMVSFAKTAKGQFGKTLLAKKRNTLENEQKKSLSDIFSSKLKNQAQLNVSTTQKHDIDKSSVQNKEHDIVNKEPIVSKEKKKGIEKGKRKEKDRNKKIIKKHKEKIVNDNIRESDKTSRLSHRAGGKISSLFGNNPHIPTIGQRFIKPVNESIFTEITFEDLNIHPFMVSVFYTYSKYIYYMERRTFVLLLSSIDFLLQISNLAQNMNITKMTTVQQKAIPQIFSAKNVLIRSQTGSGKTLAYAIPIVESLHKIRPKLSRNCGLSALIVVPTRELALQTYECFIKLVKVSYENIS